MSPVFSWLWRSQALVSSSSASSSSTYSPKNKRRTPFAHQLPGSSLLLNTHQPHKSHQYFLACLVMPLELCEPMPMKYWLLPIQLCFASCNIQGDIYFHNKRSDIDRALFSFHAFIPFQFLFVASDSAAVSMLHFVGSGNFLQNICG